MDKKQEKKDLDKLSFEETIDQLTAIVSRIEQGKIALEESLEQYERGMALIGHCRRILATAEKRIEKIAESQAGAKGQQADEVPF